MSRRRSAARRWPWVVAGLSVAAFGVAGAIGFTTTPTGHVPALGTTDVGWWIAYLTFTVFGALVTTRRPDNAVGPITLAAGAFNAFAQLTLQYSVWTLFRHPGSLPFGSTASWASTFLWAPSTAVLAGLVLVFPNGSLPSRRWRWVVALLATVTVTICVATAADLWSLRGSRLLVAEDAVTRHRLAGHVIAVGWPIVLGCVIASMVSLVVRYRRALGVERQQLKWLMAAAVVTAPMIVGGELTERWPTLNTILEVLNTPGWFAIAVALAVLRYRLYDIDRIVSRTVSYAALTAALVGLYVGVVALTTDLLPFSSSFAVATSTLVVAALFQPLRRRLQALVDRRFNRAGYDAARTVETFSGRLRNGIDLNVITGDLVGVVGTTVQPATVSLWVAP